MAEAKSALTEKPDQKKYPSLNEEETRYHGAILSRLVNAKTARDAKHPEFNNKTFIENYIENERLANTFIERKAFDKDIVIASGTVEQKLYTVAAEINRLNLTAEVRVYDRENNEYEKLATALTDTIYKTEEMEGDDENKLLRQVEMLKQGHVFVQDNWVCEFKNSKKLIDGFTGQVNGVSWEKKFEKVFEGPRRSILYGPGVYLGNIRTFGMKQPYIFTTKVTSYSEAMSRYGAKTTVDGKEQNVWERWENVPRKLVQLVDGSTNLSSINLSGGWSLVSILEDQVEEIHYQDEINDEYQVYLNGIPMLPVGFPLSAVTAGGRFNVTMQVLQAINPFFAYGRSFVMRTRENSDLLDEMLRLLILKTRKSIHPPYANISGKVISAKSLMPGVISMNVDPGALVAIGKEGEGATASEYQMLKELRENIDKITVSPQVQGQQGKSGTTAYEVQLLQKQAQKVLSLIVFASSSLEKKVGYLRLNLILWKYFDPIGTRVSETGLEDARTEIRNVYRKISRNTNIDSRGSGTRMVIPTDKPVPPSDKVFMEEEYMGTPEPQQGHRRRTRDELGMKPYEIIYLSVDELRAGAWIFYIEVDTREKDTSNSAKMMFREELRDIQALMQMGSQPNVEELENTYALIWKRPRNKMFKAPVPVTPEMSAEGAKMLSQSTPAAPMAGE